MHLANQQINKNTQSKRENVMIKCPVKFQLRRKWNNPLFGVNIFEKLILTVQMGNLKSMFVVKRISDEIDKSKVNKISIVTRYAACAIGQVISDDNITR